MARLLQATSTGRRIAVIEDEPALLESTIDLVAREGHEVRGASSPQEALELARTWQPHLMLLDYYLAGGTGASVVRELRTFDSLCQVLLVTGYASEQPARHLLRALDIQGFHDKADGPARLMVLVDAALKHHVAVSRLDAQRRKLRHILEVLPELTRLQPPADLLKTALLHVGRLLQGTDGFVATANNGLFVIDGAVEGISIHAAIGRYAGLQYVSELAPGLGDVVRDALRCDRPTAHPAGWIALPMQTRSGDRGCMLVQGSGLPEDAVEACELYMHQAVQALENTILYEKATVDPLTRVYNRAHGFHRLEELLRLGERTGEPTGVAMMDVDRFKALNDTYGHAAGDLALFAIAAAVKEAARSGDVVARYGGEELLLAFPATDAAGTTAACERMRRAVANLELPFEGHTIRVTASFGVSVAQPGELQAEDVTRRADRALYRAKQSGRDRICVQTMQEAA